MKKRFSYSNVGGFLSGMLLLLVMVSCEKQGMKACLEPEGDTLTKTLKFESFFGVEVDADVDVFEDVLLCLFNQHQNVAIKVMPVDDGDGVASVGGLPDPDKAARLHEKFKAEYGKREITDVGPSWAR